MTELKQTERERLIKELDKLEYSNGDPTGFADCDIELMADFILADRRRVLEPIITHKEQRRSGYGLTTHTVACAIDTTLKLAGLTTE